MHCIIGYCVQPCSGVISDAGGDEGGTKQGDQLQDVDGDKA